MAADRTGRRGFGIELESKYVQRSIRKFIRYAKNQGNAYEVKRNGQLLNEEELIPFMPKTKQA